MTQPLAILAAALFAFTALAQAEKDVDALLSRMHEASKNADVTYFDLFADDAVFFGTDLWERWTKDEFESLYRPYMGSGRGWEFKMRDRCIDLQPCGTIALFDEALFSQSFGPCRASGAARLDDHEWRIVRYHLDITIPNDVVDQVTPIIAAHHASRVELMTFNIRFGTADDGDNAWPVRCDSVAALIRGELPDVVGVQEALRFQVDELESVLPGYGWVGVGRDDGKDAGEFTPIFYREDRLAVVESGTFWLSDTPDEPGSASYGNQIPRICTWAAFARRDSAAKPQFVVMNVHLDHQSSDSRLRSAQQIVEAARDWDDLPVFVVGDLNAGPDSPPLAALLDAGWTNTAAEPAATFNGFRDKADSAMIDFVLAPTGYEIDEWEIIDDRRPDGGWPSDHLPVRAIVSLVPPTE
ncbi:MAG: nuclear transport factor 2 family protein [Planctomycetota bacterium]